MRSLKVITYNIFIFLILILLIELFFGYWFKKENFGIYMRKERKINWQTSTIFNQKKYDFFYKRNYWGFRGEEFDPKDVKIIFEGGSTGNQRFTPEELTIVGQLNKKLNLKNSKFKIYNASTDGKSLNGYINDFKFWLPKITDLNPDYVIFYIGINDTYVDDRYYLDLKISKKKIDQIKDYIKNNSFFVDKFKIVKNKYFPKNTLAYDFNNEKLYNDFIYTNFKQALTVHKKLDDKDLLSIKRFNSKLSELKEIIKEKKFQPIFITQLKYDGLKDKRLFIINNELKKFALDNNFYLIPIDEFLIMNKNDFYDPVHTTPKGSKKIANAIFEDFYEYLKR